MNLERADASYAAWDQAIVAKSRQVTAGRAQSSVDRPADSPPSASSPPAAQNFKTALAFSNDHERDYDVTWRSQAAASGSGPAARDPKNEDFGFWDFVDIINPLQHIPVVSTIYRELTGDEISAPARIMGGALYGGPLGFAASIGNAIVEEVTGKDAGEIAMAMVFDEGTGSGGPVLANTGGGIVGPAQANLGATSQARPTENPNPMTTNEPKTPVNAGQNAVLQEMAGNAALQDLLKGMGLAANHPAAAPAAATTNQAVAHQTAPLKTAQPAVTATSAQSAERASLVAATQSSAVSGGRHAQVETQAQAATPRRSIPIDTSRYINPKAASSVRSDAAHSETAVNRPQEQTAAKSTVAGAANGPNKTSDNDDLRASFADRMLQALDRYQAMSKQQTSLPDVNAAGQPASPRPGAI